MSKVKDIKYFDLASQKFKTEKVFGESFLRWLYESRSGSILGQYLTHEIPCELYGKFKSSKLSTKQISEFINKFDINMDEFPPVSTYQSFNDFFCRKFREGKRSFPSNQKDFPAFCEGRYLIYDDICDVPVKGPKIDPLSLLKVNGEEFKNGQLIICRLAPVDYHLFHYPDDGSVDCHYKVNGPLDSVSPFALLKKPSLLNSNKREITLVETKNFGKIAMIEVGAFCVGSIIQDNITKAERGSIKGRFLFGGSTVIILTKEKVINFNTQILEHSKNGIETFVKLGEVLGEKR